MLYTILAIEFTLVFRAIDNFELYTTYDFKATCKLH